MQAVILCGGLGTRLREETEFKPKPMVTIGPHPILWHIMKHYGYHGIKDFVLCLGYKGNDIRDYFLNYHIRRNDMAVELSNGSIEALASDSNSELAVDWRVVLADTGDETQTGQRIRRVLKYVRGDTFLATYGDGVADVDIDAVVAHHRQQGKLATVTAVHPSSRFGEMQVKSGLVSSFIEKPQVSEGWVNGGFFVFEKRAFDHLDPFDDSIQLERDVLERLAKQGQLAVYNHEGFWQCMDTYREMQLLNEMWAQGNARWKRW